LVKTSAGATQHPNEDEEHTSVSGLRHVSQSAIFNVEGVLLHCEATFFGLQVNLLVKTSAGATQHPNDNEVQTSVSGLRHVSQSAISRGALIFIFVLLTGLAVVPMFSIF